MTKKKNVTAAELMAELEADPEWVARRDTQEQERLERVAEFDRAVAPVLSELRSAGYGVKTADELTSDYFPWDGPSSRSLPILLSHLQKEYPSDVKELIARSLAVPGAAFAFPTLKRLLETESDGGVRSGIAVALSEIADDELMGELIGLALDRRHGTTRCLLLSALERSGDPRAYEALVELAPELEEARIILKRLERKKRDR